ncbi:MAG: molecular chaperone HtpG [Paludibacteraceae bacterium]|nr:molecular chaperone HtpG [Paludibacteraceae bacterium]
MKGNIGVTTDNIFPIIKKFLYSDHEIFLRELVSNAVDATQKLKTFSSVGEFKGELGELRVKVSVDKDKGTITISDRGIGMTADDIEKYINQIAFSGAEEFLEKYKNDANAIIGHFGLGFYSSFMVSKEVEIVTLSHKEGAKAVRWTCDGTPEYSLEEVEKADRGTDIILHIDDENKDFLEDGKVNGLLSKYCKFLPVEIAFGKKTEWKDGKNVETDEDNIINDPNPAWVKKPADLKDEDYNKFYHDLYPMAEDPLFHIHLNVDYPFNLTGILYFPKVKSNIELQKNKIQLYCNQVFVTDSVEGIVPEFLTLLHGVIDSPDIPLNVSRSYLQSDSNVKKISSHITKKVSDSLQDIFKKDRADFEDKWDSLKLFIVYGMLTDEKFYDKAEKYMLFKNTDGKYFTLDEYKTLISTEQTDKDGNVIYLYTNDATKQHGYVEAAKAKGYDVLVLDGQLDTHFINTLEQKNEKSRFVRVDADVPEKLIVKTDLSQHNLNAEQQSALTTVFRSQLPTIEKTDFIVSFENVGAEAQPIIITQQEFMRRMKEMAATGGGGMMGFYGEMPDSYNLVVNVAHPLVKKILTDEEAACQAEVSPLVAESVELESKIKSLKDAHKDKKDEEVPQAEKEEISSLESKTGELKTKKETIISGFAAQNKEVRQLIDLALLSNNMLKGEALSNFVKRSIELMK